MRSNLYSRVCFIALTLIGMVAAFDPKVSKTLFEGGPRGLIYFESSSVILYHDEATGTITRSEDDGTTWSKIKFDNKEDLQFAVILEHKFDENKAYALSSDGVHYKTDDQGASWSKFEIPCVALVSPNTMAFNSKDVGSILVTVEDCPRGTPIGGPGCKSIVYYTTDGFRSKASKLIEDSHCQWAFGANDFESTGLDKSSLLCSKDSKLYASSNYMKTKEAVKVNGNTAEKILSFGSVSKFIVAAFEVDTTRNAVGLLVTTDAKTWNKAKFPQEAQFAANSFTILESSTHSLHVDVRNQGDDSDFYTSNSDGTVFTKSLQSTNRNSRGYVDLEKVAGIDGILIANVREKPDVVRTKISYDDGRTWQYIAANEDCTGDSSCGLNLHSVTDHRNVGRVFSSPAPGILAGIGGPGSRLRPYEAGDLWVSEDSGLTWHKSENNARIYAFGDQGNLLVSIRDDVLTDLISYSTDRGKSWNEYKLDKKYEMEFLFTEPDSSSSKFVLLCMEDFGTGVYVVSLDFQDIFSKKCEFKDDGTGDFEKWYARYDSDGEPYCIMGSIQEFWRKKKDSQCYVGQLHKEPIAVSELCACQNQDYECDTNFDTIVSSDGSLKCVPNAEYAKKLLQDCTAGETYERPAGYRLVPGDFCLKGQKDSVILDTKVKEVCGSENFAGNGNITHHEFEFEGEILSYVYLKNDVAYPGDETVLLRTTTSAIYITHDQGANWSRILDHDTIVSFIVHPYANNVVYFLGSEKKLYYSTDRGHSIIKVDAPASLNPFRAPRILNFHQANPEWLIFTGEIDCDEPFELNCELASFYSQDYGHSWTLLLEKVNRCSWIGNLKEHTHEQLIFCDVKESGTLGTKLIASDDFFQTSNVLLEHVLGFALEDEFVAAATIDRKSDELNAMVTVDGRTFASARFPSNFKVDHQQAYTILDSKTHALFMHVTVSDRPKGEFGALLKSNFNGTDYVMSLENVNRDGFGFVDFEKMRSLEGVALANVVTNYQDAASGKSGKKLKTMITHNDGSEWMYLPAPAKGVDGDVYCKGKSSDQCSLHLHGYTERPDYRDAYSSVSAVGLMVATGNVGEFMGDRKSANTYLTRDAGLSWKEIMKGPYLWEFGDSGSIIVLVDGTEATNKINYSVDEGATWEEYQFGDDLVKVHDVISVPSSTSRKFILMAKEAVEKGSKSFAVEIDFTQYAHRKCVLDSSDSDLDDFELWSPRHPLLKDDCLFGHEAVYHRKIVGRDCYIGDDIGEPHMILKNCSCTRQDFECDFNYALDSDGTCKLVPGYTPPDHQAVCREMPGTVQYWEPTGYRRIAVSTCDGGLELDKIASHPCPGYDNAYKKLHGGLRGFALFSAIVLPICMAVLIGYVIYDHYTKQYGQIRLGEEDAYRDQHPVVQAGVITIAAVITFVHFLPDFLSTVYRAIASRFGGQGQRTYTTRSSFARRSADYLPTDADEIESGLLVNDPEDDYEEEEDEEHDEEDGRI